MQKCQQFRTARRMTTLYLLIYETGITLQMSLSLMSGGDWVINGQFVPICS